MIMINHNLRIFLAVAEKGSITEVANELYISQPAVSKAIKLIEKELNVKLFFRDKRKGLILTDAGHEILNLARQMANVENRIYQSAFRANNFIGGKVRIASMPIITSVVLAPVLFEFRKKYPDVSIELLELSSRESRRAIEEHRVDFAVISAPFGDLDYQVIMKDRMVAVSKDILDQKDSVDLSIRPEKFIFCRAGHETAMEMLKTKKINISAGFLVEQAETILSLVENRNGIGVVSELVLDHTRNSLHRYPTKPKIEYDIGIVSNDLTDLTLVATALKEMIVDFKTI